MYAVMRLNYIPAGMELFPAVDEEQVTYIKRVIDMSDYYILIIGGRYGSLTNEGLSYTEEEYDYAVEKNKKVIALLHKSPDKIPVGKSDMAPDLREKLATFRKKVETGKKMVSYWENADELSALAMAALIHTANTFPAVGWIRGNTITNPEAFQELNDVRKELQRLKEENEKYANMIQEEDLISRFKWVKDSLCVLIEFRLYDKKGVFVRKESREMSIRWDDILLHILPYVSSPTEEEWVKKHLNRVLAEIAKVQEIYDAEKDSIGPVETELERNNFNEIKIRLMGDEIIYTDVKIGTTLQETHGITNRINTVKIDDCLIWSLSQFGAKLYTQLQNERIIE